MSNFSEKQDNFSKIILFFKICIFKFKVILKYIFNLKFLVQDLF